MVHFLYQVVMQYLPKTTKDRVNARLSRCDFWPIKSFHVQLNKSDVPVRLIRKSSINMSYSHCSAREIFLITGMDLPKAERSELKHLFMRIWFSMGALHDWVTSVWGRALIKASFVSPWWSQAIWAIIKEFDLHAGIIMKITVQIKTETLK